MDHINLVPSQYEKSFKRKWYFGFGILGGILSIMVAVLIGFVPIRQIDIEQEKQRILDIKLNREQLAEVKNIMQDIERVSEEKSNIELISSQIDMASHISRKTMDSIVGCVPKGLRINEVVMDGVESSMTIRGNAKNITNIAGYIVNLYNTKQFENIAYTTNPNKDSGAESWIGYHMEIQFKSPTQDKEEFTEEIENWDEIGDE